MSVNQPSPLEAFKDQILKYKNQGKSATEIQKILHDVSGVQTSTRSIQRQIKNWSSDFTTYTSQNFIEANSTSAGDAEDLMKERGLDPNEWIVERLKISEWESPNGEMLHALNGTLIRKSPIGLISPARADGYIFSSPKQKKSEGGKLVVCVGDQQAPFHDKALHKAFCRFLQDTQPEEGVLLGDTLDFSDISRHRLNPERGASAQESIQAGYEVLRDYRHASPDTQWVKLPGNHDERLRNIVIDQLINIYGITRAQVNSQIEPAVISVEHLLRLDELGIEYIDPQGQYDQAQYTITSQVAARHGWLASKGSGTTALKSLEQLGYSIVVGHSHRQSIVHKTLHDIFGNTKTVTGIETGCMCELGLGYATAEDWQQGMVTLSISDDGSFHPSLATFKDGKLYWQDGIY